MTAGGWHPDPTHRHEMRWWDGATWTDHVSDRGVTGVDPLSPLAPPTSPAIVPAIVPGTAAAAPARSRRTAIIAGLAGVAAVGIGLVVLTRGDDGDGGSTARTESTDESDATTATTAASDTVVVTTATTAAPATTAVPETTLEPTTTVAPTTTLAPATADGLVAALPTDSEMPAGWTSTGDTVDAAPTAATGFGQGLCGGDNAVKRAQASAGVAFVHGRGYTSESGGWFATSMYAFATPDAASTFMSATSTQAGGCFTPINYQLPEGDQPGQYDGFADDFGLDAVWSFTETSAILPLPAPGAEETFQVTDVLQFSTNYDGTDYGGTEMDVVQYERHGQVVLVFDLYGSFGLVGFTGIDPALDYAPTSDDLVLVADVVRPPIVERLRAQGFV